MRVSCCENDPGYENFQGYGRHAVLLNGSVVPEAIAADEERGEVIRLARDEYGDIVRDDEQLFTELVRGKVEIVTEEVACRPETSAAVSEGKGAAVSGVGLAPASNSGSTPGCLQDRDSRTGTGPQRDAGTRSREAGNS